MKNLFQKIADHIFGCKYYAVVQEEIGVVASDGTSPFALSGYIFRSKADATCFYYQMLNGRKFKSVEIISFRSRNSYRPFNKNYLIDLN